MRAPTTDTEVALLALTLTALSHMWIPSAGDGFKDVLAFLLAGLLSLRWRLNFWSLVRRW